MSPEDKKRVAELKEQIRKTNIMISYHQKKLQQYREEKRKLHDELDTLKDDFWNDV